MNRKTTEMTPVISPVSRRPWKRSLVSSQSGRESGRQRRSRRLGREFDARRGVGANPFGATGNRETPGRLSPRRCALTGVSADSGRQRAPTRPVWPGWSRARAGFPSGLARRKHNWQATTLQRYIRLSVGLGPGFNPRGEPVVGAVPPYLDSYGRSGIHEKALPPARRTDVIKPLYVNDLGTCCRVWARHQIATKSRFSYCHCAGWKGYLMGKQWR